MNYKKYIYEFEEFDLNNIEELYGKFRKYGVGKFLDLVYRKSIRKKNFERDSDFLNNEGFVYISKIDIERYLGNGKDKNGEYYWNRILKSLSKRKIIKYRRSGRNKYDFNKRLWFVRLDDKIYNSKKSRVINEDKNLVKWLNKKNEEKLNKWLGVKSIGDKKVGDWLVGYELNVCRRSKLEIKDLEEVINYRISNKIRELNEESKWLWISKKRKEVLVNRIIDEDKWIEELKNEYRKKYEIITEDLKYLKSGEYYELSDDYFKRDEFGNRIYNVYSNVIREYRKYIKIDDEEVVEIDLKNSMICQLYYMVKLLLVGDEFGKDTILNEVYWELDKLNNGYKNEEERNVRLGFNYLNRWNYILNVENNLNKDYYNFLKEEFKSGSGIELSRNSLKELLFVILFGNEKKLNSIRLGDNNYKDLESLLLGNSRFLINDLKNISLFSWYKNKDYKKYKNVSLILMRLERKLMDVMSNIMIQNKFDYISLFDGFMVKKSEVNEIEKLLNSHLESIDKVFRLVVK